MIDECSGETMEGRTAFYSGKTAPMAFASAES